MTELLYFMIFWMSGILVVLLGAYLWYSHWVRQKKAQAVLDQAPPPKPKMIQFHKLGP